MRPARSHRRIVDVDGEDVAGLGFEIERGAGLDIQPARVDFERSGVRTGEGQGVGAEAVVGDHDVGDLERRAVLVFSAIVFTWLVSATAVVRGLAPTKVAHPQLRVIEIAAAVLADDVEGVGVHRQPFVLLRGDVERIAWIGLNGQRL